MSSPSHEHLLGFLLGALDAPEHEQIEAELANDPQLRREAELLRERLDPLEEYRATETPPPGLASRTCSFVFEHLPEAQPVVTPAHRSAIKGGVDYGDDGAGSRWSLADLVVAAGIFMTAGLLFFPAIANSRNQAHRAICQDQMRRIAEARGRYVLTERGDLDRLFDYGINGAAGIQLVLLSDNGFLSNASQLICPGSPQAQQRVRGPFPTCEDLDAAPDGPAVVTLLSQAAGSMAFSLGTMPGVDPQSPFSDERVVVSDAPSGIPPNMVSSHHDGKGQNVLFASGRVVYICGCGEDVCGDALFWNRLLRVEAGVHPGDHVVAAGGTYPISIPNYTDR